MRKDLFLLLFFPVLTVAFLTPASAEEFEQIDNLLAGGETEMALQLLDREQAETPHDRGEISWRRARAYYELGRISENAARRSVTLRHAEESARRAVTADPQNDEGYKWLAIALGTRAKDADLKTRVQLSRQVKENIDKALALNPRDDISLLVLSRWHYKVASLNSGARIWVRIAYGGLPDASLAEAETLLRQAIAEHDRISHRYNLAKVYHRQGRRDAALDQLRMALTLPVTFPEEKETREKARRKLQKWIE